MPSRQPGARGDRSTPGPSPETVGLNVSLVGVSVRCGALSPIDGTQWLPNKEMTKLWEVSDETSTDRFPHFQCLTLQCDTSTLNLRPGGRVGSPRGRGRLTSEVSLGVGGGGCFPGNDTGFPGLASDPTRPDPTLTSEPNFHILSTVRTPFGPTPHWRVLTRRVGRFHILK